jgi:hypothetical protein
MGGECVEDPSGAEFSLHGDIVSYFFGEWWRSGCFVRLRNESEAHICCENGGGGIFPVHKSEKIGGGFLIWECGGE